MILNRLKVLMCLVSYVASMVYDLAKVRDFEAAFDEIASTLESHKLQSHHVDKLYDMYTQAYTRPSSSYRKEIFQQSLELILAHNQKKLSWTMGPNYFLDLTFEEFRYSYLLHAPQNCSATEGFYAPKKVGIPDSFDWRDYGIVSPVKNQLKCGSCWTFSTTGALEAHWKLHKHQTVSLSEQQLVDCAGDFDNHGCNGGLPSHAFEYIRYVGGLQGEDTYPYEAVTKECRFNHDKVIAHVPLGAVNITANDESALTEAIAIEGPVSVAFEVVGDFRFYKSGVYTSTECKNGPEDVNHAVLSVGYGVDEASGKKYYIIKNSWSETWGDKGYFKIERNVNMCGIAQCNSFPNVGKCVEEKHKVAEI